MRLLGAAGRRFVRELPLLVATPAEAIRALCALFPEFRAWVLEQHQAGIGWRVVVGRHVLADADQLGCGSSSDTFTFAPVLAGRGTAGRIILGTVLIAAAFIAGPAGIFGLSSLSVGLMGGALVLGGVAALLTPTPKTPAEAKTTEALESNLFTRAQGTDGQGEPVPLLYGRRRVKSPRVLNFSLRNLPQTRNIDRSGVNGLLGYVAQVGI